MSRPPDNSFWAEPCPARGSSLTHAHWAACKPDGGHPPDNTGNEGNTHPYEMCCHCQMTKAMMTEADIAMREMGLPAQLLPAPTDGQCTVDHNSITSKLVLAEGVGDLGPPEGARDWHINRTTCPICGVPVEPKLATGEVTGPIYGRGRGELSERHKMDLETVLKREKFQAWSEGR